MQHKMVPVYMQLLHLSIEGHKQHHWLHTSLVR
jgi:hypothetical protein